MGHAVKGDNVYTNLIAVEWDMAQWGYCMHIFNVSGMGYDLIEDNVHTNLIAVEWDMTCKG